jgi:hypothetical protein
MRAYIGDGAVRVVLFLATLLVLAAVPACEQNDEIDEATRQVVVQRGEQVALHLMQTLSGRLTAAMSEGGPPAAISFCSEEAHALTASVVEGIGHGWEVKRATLRPRNPDNAPDDLEEEALEFFHAAEAAGQELPEHLVQRTPDGDYRYYRPLLTAAMCVQCHGPAEELSSEVVQVLAQRYPDDQAIGYREGDLRGLIRVTVPADAVHERR